MSTTKTKAKVALLSSGTFITLSSIIKVVATNNSTTVVGEDEDGNEVTIEGNNLLNCVSSASSYTTTIECSRTEIVEKFNNNPQTLMTVNYNLKVKEADVVKQIQELYPNKGKIVSKNDFNRAVKKAVSAGLKGVERTAVGKHSDHVDSFGRYLFIDVEKEKDSTKNNDNRLISIDPRTINWLIVNGVKYIVS